MRVPTFCAALGCTFVPSSHDVSLAWLLARMARPHTRDMCLLPEFVVIDAFAALEATCSPGSGSYTCS